MAYGKNTANKGIQTTRLNVSRMERRISDRVKLAEIRSVERIHTQDVIAQGINNTFHEAGILVSNPMVAMIGGVLIVEYARRQGMFAPIDNSVLGRLEAIFKPDALEAAIVGATMTNAVAKSGILQQLVSSGGEAVKTTTGVVKDVLPLLLAAGAAV